MTLLSKVPLPHARGFCEGQAAPLCSDVACAEQKHPCVQVVEDVKGHMAKAKMEFYQKCAPLCLSFAHNQGLLVAQPVLVVLLDVCPSM